LQKMRPSQTACALAVVREGSSGSILGGEAVEGVGTVCPPQHPLAAARDGPRGGRVDTEMGEGAMPIMVVVGCGATMGEKFGPRVGGDADAQARPLATTNPHTCWKQVHCSLEDIPPSVGLKGVREHPPSPQW